MRPPVPAMLYVTAPFSHIMFVDLDASVAHPCNAFVQ
jgi:hypothetical protein